MILFSLIKNTIFESFSERLTPLPNLAKRFNSNFLAEIYSVYRKALSHQITNSKILLMITNEQNGGMRRLLSLLYQTWNHAGFVWYWVLHRRLQSISHRLRSQLRSLIVTSISVRLLAEYQYHWTNLKLFESFNATVCDFRRGLKLKNTWTVKNTYIVSAKDNYYKADCE